MHILKSFLFYHSFFIACHIFEEEEEEKKEVISYHLKSIRWDEIISSQYCEENQDSLFVEGINGLYSRDVWYVSDPVTTFMNRVAIVIFVRY